MRFLKSSHACHTYIWSCWSTGWVGGNFGARAWCTKFPPYNLRCGGRAESTKRDPASQVASADHGDLLLHRYLQIICKFARMHETAAVGMLPVNMTRKSGATNSVGSSISCLRVPRLCVVGFETYRSCQKDACAALLTRCVIPIVQARTTLAERPWPKRAEWYISCRRKGI